MKTFKQFQEAAPTNSANTPAGDVNVPPGYSATAEDPVTGYSPFLYPQDDDLLDQGFQGPGETGQDRWNRFFGVVPVERITLKTKLDGEDSIDQMVDASKEYVAAQDSKNTQRRFNQFRNR